MTTQSVERYRWARSYKALLPLALLFLYAILGGATFTISKIAFGAGVSPGAYTFWQCAGAAAVMVGICGFKGISLPLEPRYLRFYIVCGLVGLALPNIIMFHSLARLPAGVMAVVVATVPVFTCALSNALSVERFKPRRAVGIALGVAGALFILLPRVSLSSPDLSLWAGVAFLAPFLYAVTHIYVARARPDDASAVAITAGMLIVASLALAPIMLDGDIVYVPRFPIGLAETMILLQIVISSICYLAFFAIVRRAGPVFFSQVGYLVTVTGLIWAILVFDESYSVWLWLAVGLIFAGLALVNDGPWRALRRKAA